MTQADKMVTDFVMEGEDGFIDILGRKFPAVREHEEVDLDAVEEENLTPHEKFLLKRIKHVLKNERQKTFEN